jgi:hypothetical protein
LTSEQYVSLEADYTLEEDCDVVGVVYIHVRTRVYVQVDAQDVFSSSSHGVYGTAHHNDLSYAMGNNDGDDIYPQNKYKIPHCNTNRNPHQLYRALNR